MTNDGRPILVIGATGMLGEPVARQLKADGFGVRILSRTPAKAARIFGAGFEHAAGDVEDPAALERAMAGCAGVHINLKGGPKPADYERTEHQGVRNIVRAAERAGVAQITHLSSYTTLEKNIDSAESAAKWRGEEALRAGAVPAVIFRATWFMESLPLFVLGKRAVLIGRQPHPLHWLAAADYARMVARAFRTPAALGKALYVYGPQAMPMRQALERYVASLDHPPAISAMPTWLMRGLGYLSFNHEWRAVADLMEHTGRIGEEGDPAEANALLGAPAITLDQWIAGRQPQAALSAAR
ncbi:MAG TPA: NAD(P)H-binding protein [Herpetosiphonaceae bacterium]|nr:NAD(P)H-binding protein [Herpetosiphonaceae bacterium]